MPVFSGRYSATIDGDFVVSLIGMRINRPWKPHRWLPVFTAMRPMIRELQADLNTGFLGATYGLLASGPAVVRYWRSFDDLERYARSQDARHLPAWRRFNQTVSSLPRPFAAPWTTQRAGDGPAGDSGREPSAILE
jgi:Domain of unknown function (DUF4188)